MTQQRLNLGLQKNLKTNHFQVQIYWVNLQICYSDLSQAKQYAFEQDIMSKTLDSERV